MKRMAPPWGFPLQQTRRAVDTTPRLDPLRGARLQPPYYGVPPLGHISVAHAFDQGSRAELASQVREREEELQSMCAFLNAGAPINRLPVELLVEIFKRLQRDPGVRLKWLDVLCVCRHWFAVGSTAAKLWQNLAVETSTNLLRTGLSRSRAARLSVVIASRPILPLVEATGLILPHLRRICKLDLDRLPAKCYPATVSLMKNDMPALRFLRAFTERSDADLVPEVALTLSPAMFPHLQELRTSGLQVFANDGIASQLHTLHVSNGYLGKDARLDTATLVDVVREMQNTKMLSLEDVRVRDLNDAPLPVPPPPSDRVALDRLEYARICTEGFALKAILSAIVIPPTANVFFHSSSIADLPYGDTYGQIIPADRSCLPILSQVTSLLADTTLETHSLGGLALIPGKPEPYFRPRVDLYVENQSARFGQLQGPGAVGVGDVIGVFYDAPLQILDIHTLAGVAVATDWRDLFSHYPKLRSFTLVATAPELGEELPSADLLFSALDPGYAPATTEPSLLAAQEYVHMGSNPVLCADLERIIVRGLAAVSDPDALLTTITTCLENRRRVLDGQSARIKKIQLQFVAPHDEDLEDSIAVQTTIEQGLSPLVDDVSVWHVSYDPAWDEV